MAGVGIRRTHACDSARPARPQGESGSEQILKPPAKGFKGRTCLRLSLGSEQAESIAVDFLHQTWK